MEEIIKFNSTTLKAIGRDGEMYSLNDLWRIADSPNTKRPSDWQDINGTKEFLDSAAKVLNTAKNGIIKSKRGKGGGTYAVRQVALEYARYLDKDLAVVANEVFLQEIEAQKNPELYLEKYRKTYKKKGKDDAWINERMKGIGSRKELTSTLRTHGVTEGHEFRECTNASYTGLFGMNAPAIREGLGITKKQSIRDNMNQTELIALSLSENLAKKDIEKRSLWGVKDCSLSCHDAAKTISAAVQGFLNR